MNANHDLNSRVARYYAAEAPPRAPDWVLKTALATVEITSQRRARIHAPWRFPGMNSYAKYAIAAVAVIALGVVGLTVLRPADGPSVGGQPASPSPPSPAPPSSSGPTTSLMPTPPPLTEQFVSASYGYAISYPAGWATRAGTEPWAGPGFVFDGPEGDKLYDPVLEDHLFVFAASRGLAGQPGEEWATEVLTSAEEPCEVEPEPITIDGADGLTCGGVRALTWAADRGYVFQLYTSGDEASLGDVYTPAWFETVLATVQLTPENAAAPSAAP
jgi:hypothetical protein